ncbi:MAG: TrmB family transcriptional regulator [Candidatus Lokiarchaeota archaeon]|nr:TrmB family transcriptional regulator [Candidatus Lokiarchaeota archaeon]
MSNEIPESVKLSLKALGFTDYEISIYLTLISRGPMDARELSEASGVPYSRVYNVLTHLEKEKMWIIKEEDSRPSRYFAKSPEEALIISKRKYKETFENHSENIIQALNQAYHSHDVPLKVPLYVHAGINACLNKILDLVQKARSSLYISCSEPEFFEAIQDNIKARRMRGMKEIKLIIEDELLEKDDIKNLYETYSEVLEIKTQKKLFANIVVIDGGSNAFVVISQKQLRKNVYFGIYTDYIGFGPIVRDFFKFLFKGSKDITV